MSNIVKEVASAVERLVGFGLRELAVDGTVRVAGIAGDIFNGLVDI